jgi:NNP family nitrate/nitrite transporter-like MFS transporter
MASSMNMGGRKLAQFTFLVVGGGLILAFSYPNQVGWSIGIFIAFSLFLTLTTGSTFALVVYVDKDATGSVAGIVASGGSVGAVAFLFMLREMEFHDAFLAMGVMVIAVACLTLLLRFPNQTQ